MGEQSARGSQIVQIQGVVGSAIQIFYGGRERDLPLEPTVLQVAAGVRSPARLVSARSGVVPYSARQGFLDELEGWLDDERAFAGFVIGGRGGSGKTRLAVELCELAGTRGWLCGLLMTRMVDRPGLEELAGAPVSRLVVVDYAETRKEQLEVLLPMLRAKATAEHPVRVLLLVRESSRRTTHQDEDWKKGLVSRNTPALGVLDECDVRLLDQMPLSHIERQNLFRTAAMTFASRVQSPVEPPDPPRALTEEDIFARPLLVVIAAYLAVHGETALPDTQTALLDELLEHEESYWQATAAGLFDYDDVLPRRVVSLVTLTRTDSETTAAKLLRVLPDFEDVDAERRGRVARWAHGLYPGPEWWNPLEPDLVGEHLVAKALTGQPGILESLLEDEDPRALIRPLEVYARAAADHPPLAAVLELILRGKLSQLCGVAIAEASSVTDRELIYGNATTAAAAIRRAITAIKVDPEVLPAAIGSMPLRSDLILGPLALTLTTQLVEHLRRLAVTNPTAVEPELASNLNNISNRLAEAGRRSEGLAAAEESTEIRRRLAAADPAAFEPELATALNSLSSRLAEMGRLGEALAAAEESTEIYRRLAAADPAAFEPELASNLNNISNRLAEAGRRSEALAAAEESTEIRRRLAVKNPAAFEPDLATVLDNRASRLAEMGRLGEALAAAEEAVGVYRRLAAANSAAFEPEFARALNNISRRLVEMGRLGEALAAAEESTEIRSRLATTNPAAFEPDLAGTLNSLSICLVEMGRLGEALAAAEGAVGVYRRLAAANPAAFELRLAIALNNLSICLVEMGRLGEALAPAEGAVGIYRRLAAANPAAFEPSLATALGTLANRLAETGRDAKTEHVRQEIEELEG